MRSALLHALLVSLAVLALFYYWFAVADRYAVFLYGHLGATPFDEITSGRYWMAGLVADGMVLAAYMTLNWLLGRLRADYRPPAWTRVWLLAAPLLIVGIPAITMTANQPALPLPLPLAATCTAVTLIGLALALMPGALAARRPLELAWLIADGVGLMPVLLLLRVVELPGRLSAVSVGMAALVAAGSVMASVAWLWLMSVLRRRFGPRRSLHITPGKQGWDNTQHPSLVMPVASMLLWQTLLPAPRLVPAAGALLAAGLTLSYLVMPLIHHLFFAPPGYKYISASANFFASSWPLQAAVFLAAALLSVGITYLRKTQVTKS